jgi:hypothetical protein
MPTVSVGGCYRTGVSIAYTVHALDAGPVIAFERFFVDECIKVRGILMSCHFDVFPLQFNVIQN